MTAQRPRGFTMIELLVVIGIITLLAGLLLPALAGVRRRASKAEESTQLRQVGIAWNLYANANNDAALPGFMGIDVQAAWDVRYRFRDKTAVPPALAQAAERNIAGPWTWRLMQYLDYTHKIVHGYAREDGSLDQFLFSASVGSDLDLALLDHAEELAYEPAFGYNAYYVGGWWKDEDIIDVNGRDVPQMTFGSASVVVRSPSAVENSARLVLFCSSAEVDPGQHDEIESTDPGAHYVVPPFLAEDPQWRRASTPAIIDVLTPTAVPLGRYTGQVAVLHADLHTEPQTPGTLADQRFWVNKARDRGWTHAP